MKTRSIATSVRTLALLGPILLLASCASEMLYETNRSRLERAGAQVTSGEGEVAAKQMEKLLVETSPAASEYVLQRFFASYLLARAHMEASFGEPFLEGTTRGDSSFSLSGEGGESGSSIANLVAGTYYAGFGRQWYRAASGAKPVVDGEKLLPPELEALGTRQAMIHLNLILLTADVKLNFQDRIEFLLGEMAELGEMEKCEGILADSGLGAAMQPWVYRGVFDFLEKRDEIAAYKFAIRVLDLDRGETDHDPALIRGLASWITEGSKYVFKCPSCSQEVDPALPSCTVCRRPNCEFEPEERVANSDG
jgi:hypothetical protein